MSTPADELKAAAEKLRPSSPAVAEHTVAVRLSPAVADALADLLDAEAKRYERAVSVGEFDASHDRPLAVARQINGPQ